MVMLKREDCNRTKHDSNFSKWQILVASSDWEDYSLGKEGAAKYRIHNLPKNPGPGLYELGIAVSHSGLGREIAKLDADRIVVVYLGEADNVRTRLQHYGRSGSHLGNGYLCISDSKIVPLEKRPGFFQEIFLRGYSITYRWAPMQSKREAQMTEAQLLRTFDYAWNTSGNGARRQDDVLKKLEDIDSRTAKFTLFTRKLLPFRQKRLGIEIKTIKQPPLENKPTDSAKESNNFLARILNFSRSRPRLVAGSGEVDDADNFNNSAELLVSDVFHNNGSSIPICGVALYDGTPCTRQPVQGRKRCEEHKGQRIRRSNLASTKEAIPKVVLDVNMDRENHAATHYEQHSSVLKPERILRTSGDSSKISDIRGLDIKCGVELGHGLTCTRQPVKGRVRCEEHKGMRTNRSVSRQATRVESKVSDTVAVC